MNKFLVLMAFLTIFVSCSSQKNLKNEVKAEASAVAPVTDPRTQYERAITMIQSHKELNEKQKSELVSVINNYALKSNEIRKKQSQYRVVLVNEMLNSGTKRNPKVGIAKKSLQNLYRESNANLGKFIRDFKFHSGDVASDSYQPVMREVLRVQ